MRTITLYRSDFRIPDDGTGDFFNDTVIEAGLAENYEECADIDQIELVIDKAIKD